MNTVTRVVITGGAVIAVAGAPLAARQDPAAATSQEQVQKAGEPQAVEVNAEADAELKRQVVLFEAVLRDAVEQGGQRLAQWARQIEPRVELALAATPVVQAVPLPDASLIFNVQVPEILQTSIMLFRELQRPQGERPVSNPGRASGTGVVPPNPMAEAVRSDPVSPDRRYSDYVREALIEALLDGSAVLQVQPGQWLTVAASGVDIAVTNPLYRNPSRKLVLSIRGEDLRAFRQQQITRDEARSRILERRF